MQDKMEKMGRKSVDRSVSTDTPKKLILCKICNEKVPLNETIKLSCGHSFCKECLLKDWKIKIKEKKIDEKLLKCPEEDCGKAINYYDLKTHLPKNIFEIYDQDKNMLFAVAANEKSINCPKCQVMVIINKDSQYFTCPSCNIQYCAKEDCFGLWEQHNGKDCALYKLMFGKKKEKRPSTSARSSLSEAAEFEKYALEKNWKKCPVCGAMIEKIKNCNYVICESIKCQKKTTFCYICGDILKGEEIKTHFKDSNAFKLCKEKFEQEQKRLQFQKSQENLICPLCGNRNRHRLEINVEATFRILKCTGLGQKFNIEYSCLHCKEEIKNPDDDNNIKAHRNAACVEKKRVNEISIL